MVKKNIIRLTENDLKNVIFESVNTILTEKRNLQSQKLYDIIKKHGGVKSNPLFDLANMSDSDIVDVVNYETIYDCRTERGLRNYAISKGFELGKSDTVEYMTLNDGMYLIGVLRGGAFDYTNSNGRERNPGDFEDLCNKRSERVKNSRFTKPEYYKWENEDAEDLYKNPFFRRKEGVWKDNNYRTQRVQDAKRK